MTEPWLIRQATKTPCLHCNKRITSRGEKYWLVTLRQPPASRLQPDLKNTHRPIRVMGRMHPAQRTAIWSVPARLNSTPVSDQDQDCGYSALVADSAYFTGLTERPIEHRSFWLTILPLHLSIWRGN